MLKKIVSLLCVFILCLTLVIQMGDSDRHALLSTGLEQSVAEDDIQPLEEDQPLQLQQQADSRDSSAKPNLWPQKMQRLDISSTPETGPELMQAKSFRELAPTTTMPFAELVGDNGNYAAVTRYPARDKYKLVIDIYHQVVLAYSKDSNGNYTVPERYMVCTTGSTKTPTPLGTFSAGTHRPRFGLFVNDGVYGQYWTQVTGKIYFHSLLYTQRNANYYTESSYKLLGTRGSHGCVRLLVPDARWVYYHIGPGATVQIRAGSKSDTATANIKRQLTRAPLPKTRPNVNNVKNTDVWSISSLNASLKSASTEDMMEATDVRQKGDVYIYGGDYEE